MSKADTLLQKASVFERIAVYGDRKSFLQALGQGAPVSHPGDVEETYGQPLEPAGPPAPPAAELNHTRIQQLFIEAFKLIQQAGGNASSLQQAWQTNNPDANALASAISQASMEVPVSIENANTVARLRNIASQVKALAGSTAPSQDGSANIGARAPSAPSGQTHSPGPNITAAQTHLNYLLFGDPNNRAMPFPLKPTGRLDKETKEGLEIFKREYPKATNLNGPALFQYLKTMYDAVKWAESRR